MDDYLTEGPRNWDDGRPAKPPPPDPELELLLCEEERIEFGSTMPSFEEVFWRHHLGLFPPRTLTEVATMTPRHPKIHR